MKDLQKLIDKSTKIDASANGRRTTQTYADGMSDNKGAATNAANDVRTGSEANLAPTDAPYNHGKEHDDSFSKGILDEQK